jgi:1-acyl-sn-glycerol-3-phosphate acyltransferase
LREFHKPRLHQKFIYRIGRGAYKLAFKLILRVRIIGEENIPESGGVLLASNHASLADPPLVATSIRRPIHFFAKEELFRIPIFGWLIRQVNAFPVKRYEHDVGAFKRAQTLLENGQIVLLFPEGGRSASGALGRAKPGVGMLAYKTGAPVVPVYLDNSNQLAQFKKISVSFGKPMLPPQVMGEKEFYQSFSDRVMDAIADLKSKMYNGRPED